MAIPSEKSAKRYSRSLFELCSPSDFDRIETELEIAARVAQVTSPLAAALANPSYNLTQRLSALEAVLKKSAISDIRVINLVKSLVESRKLNLLPSIAKQFSVMLMSLRNQLQISLTSAFPLEEGELSSLRTGIKKEFSGLASVEVTIDPELLGGVKVAIGDRIVDASIRGALEKAAMVLSQ